MTALASAPLDLKSLIPPAQWEQFLADLMYKPLEQLAREGHIDGKTLSIVNTYVEKYGAGSIPFSCEPLDIPTLHTYNGGLLAKIRWPIITRKLEIVTFLKRFKDPESFKKAIKNQHLVRQAIVAPAEEGMDSLDGLVADPVYANRGLNILVNPFINGRSLEETLPYLPSGQKLERIRQVFDHYFSWKRALESKILDSETPRSSSSPISILGHPLPALAQLLGEKETAPIFSIMGPICQELHQGPVTIIHGDYNLGNIIEADTAFHRFPFYPIDWETLSIGYLEYDVGKTLSKARLTLDERQEIVAYLSELQQRKYGHDTHTSTRRHWLNFIRHHTNSIGRYLQRKDQSPAFVQMATVAYNKAVQTIERVVSMGFVDDAFLAGYSAYFEKERSLKKLSEEELTHLEARFDPDQRPSFENAVHPPSLEELALGNGFKPQTQPPDKVAELERLRKNLYPSRMQRMVRASGKIAVPLLAMALVGMSAYKINDRFEIIKRTQRAFETLKEHDRKYEEGQYHARFRENYRRAMEAVNLQHTFTYTSLDKVVGRYTYPKQLLPASDPFVEQVSKKAGIPSGLIRRMFSVNRLYALEGVEGENPFYKDINYFEPCDGEQFGRKVSIEMRENLEMGAMLLASFRDQFRRSYTLQTADHSQIIKHAKSMYSGVGTDGGYVSSGFEDELRKEPLLKALLGNNTEDQVQAALSVLALKDALIAFYSEVPGENWRQKDYHLVARKLAFNIFNGVQSDEWTGIQSMYEEVQWGTPGVYAVGHDVTFDYTSRSPITRGLISAMGFEDLKEVRSVFASREQQQIQRERQWAIEENSRKGGRGD